MFYQFMKWYLGWMVKLYFRRVYTKGTADVPNGKAVIYASNHPAGFSEPIILATNVSQAIHFLVLGSFLRSRWFQWFFRGVNMVPIFRMDISGVNTVKKNKDTFQYVYDALMRNAHMLIYPEAYTRFIYKVRPLKKGIARMAKGLLELDPDKELYIVPVGMNFIRPEVFRSDVLMHVGKAIKIDYKENDDRKRLKDILDMTAAGMQEVVFNLADEERHKCVQDLVEIRHYSINNRLDLFAGAFKKDPDYVQGMKDFVSRLDALSAPEFEKLQKRVTKYKSLISSMGLKERTVSFRKKIGLAVYLFLITGLPLFLVGMILNGFSLLAANWVKVNLVKRTEYKASVSSAVVSVLTLSFFITLVVLGLIFSYLFIILAFALTLSLWFAIYYRDIALLFLQRLKYAALKEKDRVEIREMREEILML